MPESVLEFTEFHETVIDWKNLVKTTFNISLKLSKSPCHLNASIHL